MKRFPALLKLSCLGIVLILLNSPAFSQNQTAIFTEQQVGLGLQAYQQNCSNGCHQPDMLGGGPVASLRQLGFSSVWGTNTVAELFETIKTSMPPTNVGGLTDETYLAIIAFILSANGAVMGDTPLLADSNVLINDVINIEFQPGVRSEALITGPTGITVAGIVPNYQPVSDEELRNPDPEDWLMIRGNHQAWSYSAPGSDQSEQRG